jgi:hypothetical protein
MLRIAAVVIAVAIAQYMLAFYSWSLVTGNVAPGASSDTAGVLWMAMSFPLFYVVSRDFPVFQPLLVCNAIFWGFAFGFLLPTLLQRFRKTAR